MDLRSFLIASITLISIHSANNASESEQSLLALQHNLQELALKRLTPAQLYRLQILHDELNDVVHESHPTVNTLRQARLLEKEAKKELESLVDLDNAKGWQDYQADQGILIKTTLDTLKALPSKIPQITHSIEKALAMRAENSSKFFAAQQPHADDSPETLQKKYKSLEALYRDLLAYIHVTVSQMVNVNTLAGLLDADPDITASMKKSYLMMNQLFTQISKTKEQIGRLPSVIKDSIINAIQSLPRNDAIESANLSEITQKVTTIVQDLVFKHLGNIKSIGKHKVKEEAREKYLESLLAATSGDYKEELAEFYTRVFNLFLIINKLERPSRSGPRPEPARPTTKPAVMYDGARYTLQDICKFLNESDTAPGAENRVLAHNVFENLQASQDADLKTSTCAALRTKYKRIAFVLHPDRGGDEEDFKKATVFLNKLGTIINCPADITG